MKNVEYTLDENGKIATLTIDGKPARAGLHAGVTQGTGNRLLDSTCK